MIYRCAIAAGLCFWCALIPSSLAAQTSTGTSSGVSNPTSKQTATDKKSGQKQAAAKPLSEAEELQKAIADAGNDRAALVKNLQAFLEKYPDAPERPNTVDFFT